MGAQCGVASSPVLDGQSSILAGMGEHAFHKMAGILNSAVTGVTMVCDGKEDGLSCRPPMDPTSAQVAS